MLCIYHDAGSFGNILKCRFQWLSCSSQCFAVPSDNAAEKTRNLYQPKVDAINALESTMKGLSDEQLRAKTKEFQDRCQRGESLEDLLVEAFAVCFGFPSNLSSTHTHNMCDAARRRGAMIKIYTRRRLVYSPCVRQNCGTCV